MAVANELAFHELVFLVKFIELAEKSILGVFINPGVGVVNEDGLGDLSGVRFSRLCNRDNLNGLSNSGSSRLSHGIDLLRHLTSFKIKIIVRILYDLLKENESQKF